MRNSVLAKLGVSAFLVLFLLIPISWIESLVAERGRRRVEAVAEMAGKWGGAQSVAGPFLTVPIRLRWQEKDAQNLLVERTSVAHRHLLPEELRAEAAIAPEVRRRGLFAAVLYTSDLKLSGSFRPPADGWGVPEADVLWEAAVLSVSVPDVRGLTGAAQLAWDGVPLGFRPGVGPGPCGDSGLNAPVGLAAKSPDRHEFSLRLSLRGSDELSLAPVGATSELVLRGGWPHPSFSGAYLPDRREITAQGFEAAWRLASFARNYPQDWRSVDARASQNAAAVLASMAGVKLYFPADHHQQALRAVKYAALFLVLTFVAFALFELSGVEDLHPLHYLLVGFALSLFFLLLAALGEHLGFPVAYAVSASAVVLLVSLYCRTVLRRSGRALTVGALLSALYLYLFVLLRREDDAFLLGSIGLFLILAFTMWRTRKVDWWTVHERVTSG